MSITLRFVITVMMTTLLTAGLPASAQDEPTAATVVAKVGDTEITLGHMLALRESLPPHYDQAPVEQLFSAIIDQLVQQTLLMQMVEDDPKLATRFRIENERRAIMAGEAIRGLNDTPIDEDALQAAYTKKFAGQNPETEYHAAHILVETEDEAKAIIEALDQGGNFGDLAKNSSTGPSAEQGGDLGWFGQGVMVEPFFEMVEKLKPDEVSPPLETQFGWHVIKLIETRKKDIPAFEDVRVVLEADLRQDAFDELVQEREALIGVDRSGAEALTPDIINKIDLLED